MPTHQLQAAWPLKKPHQLVYVELGTGNGGMMLGICEQGLSYRAVSPLIADGPVNFSFAFDGKTRLQGTGEIAWSEDGGKTGGLKFTSVSPEFRETVQAWLSAEAVPQNAGREVTPATAIPLDSIEKIKQEVRANSVVLPSPSAPDEQKRRFKPRKWDTPIESRPVETKAAETKPVEPPPVEKHVEKTVPEIVLPALPKAEPIATQPVAVPPVPKLTEPITVETPATERKPVEQITVEEKSIEPEAAETQLAQKSAADFLLRRAETKPAEQPRPDSGVALPKLRLPFAPAPTPLELVAPKVPVAAAPMAAKVEPAPPVALKVPEEPKPAVEETSLQSEAHLPTDAEVSTALAAPGLPGLHEPRDFVPAEPSAEEESSLQFEPPRLNRAAATAIIGLALAIIFLALVLSFRREVGEALIHFGQMLAGEQTRSTATQSSSVPVSVAPEDDSYPPASVPLRPSVSQPRSDASPNLAANSTVRQIDDQPPSTGSGNGQREFEQARNILKGNHRQRDLPLAVSLLWTGVEKGSVSAEVTLADLYARGDGVQKSCDQARVLLEAAIRRGSPEARRRLDLLKRQACS